MRRPPSLRRRLWTVGLAGVALVAALAAWLLGAAFERAASASFERSLGNEHAALVGLIEALPGGVAGLRDQPADARYARIFSGLYWQVGEGAQALRSRSLWDAEVVLPGAPATGQVEWLDAEGPGDQQLRVVRQRVRIPRAGEVLVWVGADIAPVRAEVADFRLFAGAAVGLLAALFVGVLSVQVQLGLRPLRRLGESLREVRTGTIARLPEAGLADEVAPLAAHLNELLEHQERSVQRARNAAADLAHALKTPLAVLDSAAQANEPGLAALVREQCTRMATVVRRQLDTRVAVDPRARADVAGVATALLGLLTRMHGDRLQLDATLPPGLAFPAAVEDLEEVLGNLLDNACKWARGRVSVGGERRGAQASFWVDDDGPGLAPDDAARVLDRGVRLDQQVPGSGLGLAIVLDLLALHGARLQLQPAPLGGLRVRVDWTLPGN